jgi:hypothetical protein
MLQFLGYATFVHKVPRRVCKKTLFKHIFPKIPNIDLNQDITSFWELCGQRL